MDSLSLPIVQDSPLLPPVGVQADLGLGWPFGKPIPKLKHDSMHHISDDLNINIDK